MRLSELLGAEVTDETGRALGRVHDVRLVQDGPRSGSGDATFRVLGFLVGKARVGRRFGYHRAPPPGPWFLRVLFGRSTILFLPWERVAGVDRRGVVARGRAGDLEVAAPIPVRTP
jgi:hypothetical protein